MIIDKKGCYLEIKKADNSLFCLYKLCQIRYNKTTYERRWDEMDVSEKMKYKLANAMKELLVHTPVDKITVKQIVDQCDVLVQPFIGILRINMILSIGILMYWLRCRLNRWVSV